jgi:hypothetical protein
MAAKKILFRSEARENVLRAAALADPAPRAEIAHAHANNVIPLS